MKATPINKIKLPEYRYNPELDKYSGVSLFPEKVAKAKESIKKHGLPGPELLEQARSKK